MNTYTISMNGWNGVETYTITATDESTAIQKAYKQANAPWASLIECEQE